MASPDLLKSWQRTTGFLLDARARLSQAAEVICAGEIAKFHEFVEHNELGLSLDALVAAFEKSRVEDWRVLELLALAAASMGLLDRQREFDHRLSEARGWKYETVLPESDA